jgi:hypothetical protein
MTDKDREELQAFAQKMQTEGPAGFAAGLTPWDSWDDFEERVGSRQVWQGTAELIAKPKKPPRSFGDRVLATMTVLAIATLIIGTTGVFLTQQPALQLAADNTQLPSTNPAITKEIQLPLEEDIAFNDVSISATPASPAADTMTEIGMAAGPFGDQSRNQDDSPALPATLTEDDKLFTALDELPATSAGAMPVAAPPAGQAVRTDSDSISSEPDTDSQWTLATLNELPAPAAGTAYQPSTTPSEAAVEAAIEPVIEPAVETVADEQAENPEIKTAESEINIPVQPVHLSRTSMPEADTELLQADTRDISENEQIVIKGGDWSINIASYLRDSTAEKMQQRFLDKGVAADLVTANVKGKTYYRLRVTGFESRKDATAYSATIKELLGLEETWITKK